MVLRQVYENMNKIPYYNKNYAYDYFPIGKDQCKDPTDLAACKALYDCCGPTKKYCCDNAEKKATCPWQCRYGKVHGVPESLKHCSCSQLLFVARANAYCAVSLLCCIKLCFVLCCIRLCFVSTVLCTVLRTVVRQSDYSGQTCSLTLMAAQALTLMPVQAAQDYVIDGQGVYVTRNSDTYLAGTMELSDNIAYDNGINGLVFHRTYNGVVKRNIIFNNGSTHAAGSHPIINSFQDAFNQFAVAD